MILRTGIHYGYMEKGIFHQKERGDTCEVVSIFDNGSIKGYCIANDTAIKNEIQKQINLRVYPANKEAQDVSIHSIR